jgi:hypothetical protein
MADQRFSLCNRENTSVFHFIGGMARRLRLVAVVELDNHEIELN